MVFIPKIVDEAGTLEGLQRRPVYFRDIKQTYSGSGDVLLVDNMQAINNHFRVLFTTQVGEDPIEPLFGSYLRGYLFDPITEQTAWFIMNEMDRATQIWMPYVRLRRSESWVLGVPDQRSYLCSLVYDVMIGSQQYQSFDFLLPAA